MYREPHLNEKSAECAEIWREWFDVKYNQRDNQRAQQLRSEWCQCCDEFSEMISQEVKTNIRYNRDMRM